MLSLGDDYPSLNGPIVECSTDGFEIIAQAGKVCVKIAWSVKFKIGRIKVSGEFFRGIA